MVGSETTVVDTETIIDHNTRSSLIKICEDLNERGYNPTKQIVAYLISGDPGYISSYKDARKKIQTIDRTKIIEVLLENFQGIKWDI